MVNDWLSIWGDGGIRGLGDAIKVHSIVMTVDGFGNRMMGQFGGAHGSFNRHVQNQASGHSVMPVMEPIHWVQCDMCNKWRIAPYEVKQSTWKCADNTWDVAYSKCSVPEQAEPTTTAAANGQAMGQHNLRYGNNADARNIMNMNMMMMMNQGRQPPKPNPKKRPVNANSQNANANKRAPEYNMSPNAMSNDFWVQCDECNKWRKTPRQIQSDRWYCYMNTWNPAMANCKVPQQQDYLTQNQSQTQNMNSINQQELIKRQKEQKYMVQQQQLLAKQVQNQKLKQLEQLGQAKAPPATPPQKSDNVTLPATEETPSPVSLHLSPSSAASNSDNEVTPNNATPDDKDSDISAGGSDCD